MTDYYDGLEIENDSLKRKITELKSFLYTKDKGRGKDILHAYNSFLSDNGFSPVEEWVINDFIEQYWEEKH
jgi:hypothetical protein